MHCVLPGQKDLAAREGRKKCGEFGMNLFLNIIIPACLVFGRRWKKTLAETQEMEVLQGKTTSCKLNS
jgi:hypothetical protein